MRRVVSLWLPVAAWCGLIFALSATPDLNSGIRDWDFLLRKAAHMAEYGILFLLVRRALAGGPMAGDPARALFYGMIFTIVYAASDELHQAFVPTRGPAFIDIGLDAIGAFGGLAVYWLNKRTRE